MSDVQAGDRVWVQVGDYQFWATVLEADPDPPNMLRLLSSDNVDGWVYRRNVMTEPEVTFSEALQGL